MEPLLGAKVNRYSLLTGQDILQVLQGKDLGSGILLPSLMLKPGDSRFLDDMTIEQLAQKLKAPVVQVGSSVENLIEACTQSANTR